MPANRKLDNRVNQDAMTTTVRTVLEQVVGLSDTLAIQAMNTFRLQIDGVTYTNIDEALRLRLGAWIDLEGFTRLKVIKAHFRTLDFYQQVTRAGV